MKNQVMVFKMKDIVKKAVFLAVGIVILAFVISLFTSGSDSAYNSGTYTSEIILHGNPVDVNVEIDKGMIQNITLSNLSETQAVFYPTFNECFDDISAAVIQSQSTDIELSKDYEMTGQILLDAVNSALEQAKK